MIRLGDDGTLDTVLVCTECGREFRYNYDPSSFCEAIDVQWTDAEMQAEYDDFVEWAIEDATESHVCEPEDDK